MSGTCQTTLCNKALLKQNKKPQSVKQNQQMLASALENTNTTICNLVHKVLLLLMITLKYTQDLSLLSHLSLTKY